MTTSNESPAAGHSMKGREIHNPRTGQRMIFLETAAETAGELLRIDSFNPPTDVPEPEHVHPVQESRQEVVSGSLRFVIAGEVRVLGPGESVTIPANVPHYFANDGEEEAHSIGEFRPALRTAEFFEAFFGFAERGELDAKGMPSLLQLSLSAEVFGDEIRVTQPPWAVQRLLFATVGPIARMMGYQPTSARRR